MNPFAEKYKTLSIAQLLEIIDTPENYQALAITAAEDELLARNLSIEEMAGARVENELAANEKAIKTDRKRVIEDKLVSAASLVVETVNPVQTKPVSVSRIILLISIVFAAIALFRFYSFYEVTKYALADNYSKVLAVTLPSLFEGFFLLGTAFMFWKRMKWGWIFLAVYLFFAPVGALFALTGMFLRNLTLFADGMRLLRSYAESTLFGVLFCGCCIWFLYRRSIRELYGVDRPSSIIAAAAGVFLALLVFVLIAARVY